MQVASQTFTLQSNLNFMAEQVKKQPATMLFERKNILWMGIGAVVILLGFFLMAGGKSEDPNKFNYNEVYGFTRVTLAPVLIVAGLMIEVYAILRKPDSK